MKKHTKVYFEGMNIHPSEWVACEWCGKTAVDIHHIDGRQAGGSKLKDAIENLVALCRPCHLDAESRKIDKKELRERHLKNTPSFAKVEFDFNSGISKQTKLVKYTT